MVYFSVSLKNLKVINSRHIYYSLNEVGYIANFNRAFEKLLIVIY